MLAAAARTNLMPAGLPAGRRTPRGRLRWYLAHTPEGMERLTCGKLKQLMPHDLLDDAFVLSKEHWMKRNGVWSLHTTQMYPEYFFAATADVLGLCKALSKLSFHVDVVGARERACMPLSEEVRAFFERTTDAAHVVRSSTAAIEGGVLHVLGGPLVGEEERIVKVDRHKRRCWVQIGKGDGSFLQTFALDIPCKS